MNLIGIIAGTICFINAIYGLISGKIYIRSIRNPKADIVYRASDPKMYWAGIILSFAFGTLALSIVFFY